MGYVGGGIGAAVLVGGLVVAVFLHKKRRSPSSTIVRSASIPYIRDDGVPGLPGDTIESEQLGMPGAADHRPYGMPAAADHRPYGMPGATDHRPYGLPGGLPEGWAVK